MLTYDRLVEIEEKINSPREILSWNEALDYLGNAKKHILLCQTHLGSEIDEWLLKVKRSYFIMEDSEKLDVMDFIHSISFAIKRLESIAKTAAIYDEKQRA